MAPIRGTRQARKYRRDALSKCDTLNDRAKEHIQALEKMGEEPSTVQAIKDRLAGKSGVQASSDAPNSKTPDKKVNSGTGTTVQPPPSGTPTPPAGTPSAPKVDVLSLLRGDSNPTEDIEIAGLTIYHTLAEIGGPGLSIYLDLDPETDNKFQAAWDRVFVQNRKRAEKFCFACSRLWHTFHKESFDKFIDGIKNGGTGKSTGEAEKWLASAPDLLCVGGFLLILWKNISPFIAESEKAKAIRERLEAAAQAEDEGAEVAPRQTPGKPEPRWMKCVTCQHLIPGNEGDRCRKCGNLLLPTTPEELKEIARRNAAAAPPPTPAAPPMESGKVELDLGV